MGDIKNFQDYKDENTPHVVHEAVCLNCLHRWVEVRPEYSLLKEIECPQCYKVGYVIKTGQEFKEA